MASHFENKLKSKKSLLFISIICYISFSLILTFSLNLLLRHKVEGLHTVCYTTQTGECYHASYCRYLRNSSRKTNVYKAKRRGYRECSRCNVGELDESIKNEYFWSGLISFVALGVIYNKIFFTECQSSSFSANDKTSPSTTNNQRKNNKSSNDKLIVRNQTLQEGFILVEQGMYAQAFKKYESISSFFYNSVDIPSIISADDYMRYGICSLLGGSRLYNHSFLFAYGYEGNWHWGNWGCHISCYDHKPLPKDWNTIEDNIYRLISKNPMINIGIKRGCSRQLYNMYITAKSQIISSAKDEYENQATLYHKILRCPELLSNYIDKNKGFFLFNNNLFYIYDDGNKNLYPIYKVSIVNEKIVMDFYKFSHYENRNTLPKHSEFTIKIITEHFLQLESTLGNTPIGWCRVTHEEEHINYIQYMLPHKRGRCKLCGGKSILGICTNFCRKHIKNRTY